LKADVHLSKVKLTRVLLLNLSCSAAQEEMQSLEGEGYVLFTARNLGVDQIISFQAQVLIAEATPSDLSCCHLINQIKSVSSRSIPKILLIVYGCAVERSRALELGADDVVSAPIEPVEFSALIKAQIQTKQSEAHPYIQVERPLKTDRGVEDTFEASMRCATKTKPLGVLRRVLVFITELGANRDCELTKLRFTKL
jgi:DNA-binding response OmpR family regulator